MKMCFVADKHQNIIGKFSTKASHVHFRVRKLPACMVSDLFEELGVFNIVMANACSLLVHYIVISEVTVQKTLGWALSNASILNLMEVTAALGRAIQIRKFPLPGM